MTKREFNILCGILLVVLIVLGPTGYFCYQANLKHQETLLLKEKERTERSKSRWQEANKMWKALPFID